MVQILQQPGASKQLDLPEELASLSGPNLWTRQTLRPDDGHLKIDEPIYQEIVDLLTTVRANPLPPLSYHLEDFALPACRAMMAKARHELSDGLGFVIIDRLPLDEMSIDQARIVYWLLGQMIARPVAQSWDGKMIYDVHDKGQKPGNGVRPDITNAGQNFHTDNSYNLCPPDYVALLCLKPAKSGGINSIVSLYTAYEAMRKQNPQLLVRLHHPFLFDRQREHEPDEPKVLSHPVFEVQNGYLTGRLSRTQVINGHRLAQSPIDLEGEQALEALEKIMLEPTMNREFMFERGQIQIINNLRCGHRRTSFKDHPEPERKRHLIRLWLRDSGRRFYNG